MKKRNPFAQDLKSTKEKKRVIREDKRPKQTTKISRTNIDNR